MSMRKIAAAALLLGTVFASSAFYTATAQAAPLVICTEDDLLGCIAQIPTSAPPLFVASDGEFPFSPFGLTFDVSDAIALNSNWAPDPAYAAAFAPGFWTELPGTSIWYLAAVLDLVGCGHENETSCEPVAKWYYTPGGVWAPGTPDVLWMLEADGSLSDVILVDNTGPNGSAAITFDSNPLRVVPEPMTLALFGAGLAGLGAQRRRKARKGA